MSNVGVTVCLTDRRYRKFTVASVTKTPSVRCILAGAKSRRVNMQTPYQQLLLVFENDYWS